MENDFNTLASTTYRISYPLRRSVPPPPVKYHQQPAIQARDQPQLPPRKFPISPPGPIRGWEEGTGQVLLPGIKPFTDKPIVREPPPQKIKITPPETKPQSKHQRPASSHRPPDDPLRGLKEPLPPVVPRCADGYPDKVEEGWVEELCRAYHWKTTSKAAAQEGCLPVPEHKLPSSTIGPRSSFFMYRPLRYNGQQLPWQRVAPVWDRLQMRPDIGNNVSSRQIGKQATKTGELSLSAKKSPAKKAEGTSLGDKILELVREDRVSSMFVRKCPGYAGYVPRSPLDVAMKASLLPDLRTSTTMKSSYRPFATKEYTIKEFAHKGPLSKTVTLTYPYNPYNKVENRAEEIENKW